MHVNLLPRKTLWQLLVRSRLRQWAVVWGVLGACAIAIGGAKYVELATRSRQAAAIEYRCQPLRAIARETDELQERLLAFSQKSAALNELAPQSRALAVMGMVSRSARHAGGGLQVSKLGFQSAPPRLVAGSTSAAREHSLVRLEGLATDDRAVATFVERLRQAGVFERVELKACGEMRGQGGNGRHYQVECRFE